ncbi:MAG: radical SAM protein [Eggerthellaceae bacterium]|nr:radical SAM protein [Eggerthellaceae bacterium]
MHLYGQNYRPPFEAQSQILQVTTGCSHNACAFCAMYRMTKYTESPLEEIEADLREIAYYRPNVTRIFLENGDAFGLPAERLLTIAEMIHSYLPNVASIGSYASIKNIIPKTDEELEALAKAGYEHINIGVESGLDDVIAYLKKGTTLADAREQMHRLNDAGLIFNVNIIFASAGPDRIEEHASACAALMNEVQPKLIAVSPIHADPGTPLYDDIASGRFTECTLGQYVEEEILFVRQLEMEGDCGFFGQHVSNPVKVGGILPRDKEKLIGWLESGLAAMPKELRDSHPKKGAEGRPLYY